jgi:hypothetical protein
MPTIPLGIVLRYLMLMLLLVPNGIHLHIGVNRSLFVILILEASSVFSHDKTPLKINENIKSDNPLG